MSNDTKQVGVLGRIVIPADLRRQLNLAQGAKIKISVKGNTLVITPLSGKECVICEQEAVSSVVVKGKVICLRCAVDINLSKQGAISDKTGQGKVGIQLITG